VRLVAGHHAALKTYRLAWDVLFSLWAGLSLPFAGGIFGLAPALHAAWPVDFTHMLKLRARPSTSLANRAQARVMVVQNLPFIWLLMIAETLLLRSFWDL